MTCEYCGAENKNHVCTVRDQIQLEEVLSKIERKYNQGLDREPMTSAELRHRTDSRQDIAKAIKQQGGTAKSEWELRSHEHEAKGFDRWTCTRTDCDKNTRIS